MLLMTLEIFFACLFAGIGLHASYTALFAEQQAEEDRKNQHAFIYRDWR
jgi:hypothetical protein